MKNKIAKDYRSDTSNENIEKSQQAIKFFEVLLSKTVIQQCSSNLWNLKSLLNLFSLRKKIRKFSFSIKYFVCY